MTYLDLFTGNLFYEQRPFPGVSYNSDGTPNGYRVVKVGTYSVFGVLDVRDTYKSNVFFPVAGEADWPALIRKGSTLFVLSQDEAVTYLQGSPIDGAIITQGNDNYIYFNPVLDNWLEIVVDKRNLVQNHPDLRLAPAAIFREPHLRFSDNQLAPLVAVGVEDIVEGRYYRYNNLGEIVELAVAPNANELVSFLKQGSDSVTTIIKSSDVENSIEILYAWTHYLFNVNSLELNEDKITGSEAAAFVVNVLG